jgi:hypothetical protein
MVDDGPEPSDEIDSSFDYKAHAEALKDEGNKAFQSGNGSILFDHNQIYYEILFCQISNDN